MQFSTFFSFVRRGRLFGRLPSEANTILRKRHGGTDLCLSRPEDCEYAFEVQRIRDAKYSVVTTDFAPGEHEPPWPPISSTLIYGLQDAVVVDNATHGHSDHFFGASVLFGSLPKSALCRGAQCDSSHEGANLPEFVAKFWESRFPNQLPKGLVVPQELRTNAIELEGEKRTTSLHVP